MKHKEINPTAIEPYLHGVGLINGLFDLQEKARKHGIIGKKSKRNSGELPETITDAHRDAQYLLSEAEDLLSIVTRMYERGEASAEQLTEASEAVMNLRGLEERTRRAVLELPHYRYDSSEENPRDFERLNKLSKQMDNLIDEGIMAIYRGDQDKKREILSKQARLQKQIDRERKKNPAYTVHVESPAVRESVEVHALTQGGAFRKGKARLKAKVKSHPKWSVERNPFFTEYIVSRGGELYATAVSPEWAEIKRKEALAELEQEGLSDITPHLPRVTAVQHVATDEESFLRGRNTDDVAFYLGNKDIYENPLRHGARYAGSNIADEISSPYRSFEDLEIGEAFQFPGYDNETFEKIDDNHARTLSLEPSSGYAARHQMRVDSSDTVFSLGIKVNPLHHGARYAGSNIAEMHKSSRYEKMKREQGKEEADRMAVAAGLRAAGVSRNPSDAAVIEQKEENGNYLYEIGVDFDDRGEADIYFTAIRTANGWYFLDLLDQPINNLFDYLEGDPKREMAVNRLLWHLEKFPDSPTAFKESNPSRKRKSLPLATLLNPFDSKEWHRLINVEESARRELTRAIERGDKKAEEAALKRINEIAGKLEKELVSKRNGKGIEKNMSAATASKLNSISEEFHGPNNLLKGKVTEHPISHHTKARNFSRAGDIPAIKLLHDATGKHSAPNHVCEECSILVDKNSSKLGISTGKRVQLMGKGIQAAGKRLKNKLDRLNPEELSELGITKEGEVYNLGKADTQWYETFEKHTDAPDPDLIDYYHEWAEETKRVEDKPFAKLDEDGMFYLDGGSHTVDKRGIIN